MTSPPRKRKLIEVALPLDEINAACAADKAVKTGTIRNLHKWFAPMPLPAWRALLFAGLIDDPDDDIQRAYLLDVIKRLVANAADLPDRDTLLEAQGLLTQQFPDGLPTVMDPFSGGGTTLVEAQRLGLHTYGSDLNPVPALITRALTQTLPRVHNCPPIHHYAGDELFSAASPAGYEGIVLDFGHYATAVMEKARPRLTHLYPRMKGEESIMWLWGRTTQCTNPTCRIETVLVTSWELSKKPKELAWVEPKIVDGTVHLKVVSNQSTGHAPPPPKAGRGAAFLCLACAQIIAEADIRKSATNSGLGSRLIAVMVETRAGRRFREPTPAEVDAAESATTPEDLPALPLGEANQYVAPPRYGIETHLQLFTARQATALATFADIIAEVYDDVVQDGGSQDQAEAITTLLGLAVGKMAQYNSTQTFMRTRNGPSAATGAFGRADLPMTWDFAETSPFGKSVGSWDAICANLLRAIRYAPAGVGVAVRADAREAGAQRDAFVATDPPYFDAIGYADLSDYFYMWHRRALRNVHPDLYATVATPKSGELTAFAWHHGGTKELARQSFIDGFTETFIQLQDRSQSGLPILVVYASKEQKGGREEETRWSSILTAMIDAGLEITGTWPIRGTTEARMRSAGANAVASYIVMVCRPRTSEAPTTSMADFNRALRRELPSAIRDLQASSILPVDLAQAAMGPGMQIYSRQRSVLDQAGRRVPVEQALRLINSALAEVLDEQEGELDPESRFAVRWWETHGWQAGKFGEADKAARPLGISVDDVARAHVATSHANRVQLLGVGDLDHTWVPAVDFRPTAWEAVHHLANRLIDRGGELEAARLMSTLGGLHDPAMALAYRLHDIAAKTGRTGDQERYNALINSWSELVKLSKDAAPTLEGLF